MDKKSLQFLSKNKRHTFHFYHELYWTMCLSFCSAKFCHFSGNCIIASSQNFLSFWAKNCSRCLLQSSRKLFPTGEIFSIKRICEDGNKWKSKGAMSDEYGRWINVLAKLSQLLPGHQRNICSCIIQMEDDVFSVD